MRRGKDQAGKICKRRRYIRMQRTPPLCVVPSQPESRCRLVELTSKPGFQSPFLDFINLLLKPFTEPRFYSILFYSSLFHLFPLSLRFHFRAAHAHGLRRLLQERDDETSLFAACPTQGTVHGRSPHRGLRVGIEAGIEPS